ncbi:chemotaxis protein CheW [candidate division KSB1 bacterium]
MNIFLSMEVLFFRLGNRVAGIPTRNIRIVLYNKETVPFLPLSEHVKEMLVNQGRAVGVVDLHTLTGVNWKNPQKKDIILLETDGIEYGLSVRKILLTRKLKKDQIRDADSSYSIPEMLQLCACDVGNKTFPIFSEKKILKHKDIKKLWYKKRKKKP